MLPQNVPPRARRRSVGRRAHRIGRSAVRCPAGRADAVREPGPSDSPCRPRSPTIGRRSQPGDRVLLIVDNDEGFAGVLLDIAPRTGYKGDRRRRSAPRRVALARERQPDAITLDICLPDIDGWRVLDRLKSDLATRHIPIYVISTRGERRPRRAARRHRRAHEARARASDPRTACSTTLAERGLP